MLVVVLGGGPGEVAMADDGYCLSTRASDVDERNMLDVARRIARPRRVAPETFTFCNHRSLSGRWDTATIETVRNKQPDGSETWLLVSCHRHYGKSKWPCKGDEKRGIRISQYLVEMGSNEPSFTIDASIARDLVVRATRIAADPPADLEPCHRQAGTEPDPANAFTQSWNQGDALSVWTDGQNRWSVVRKGGADLQFMKRDGQTGFTPDCWNPAVLVVE
jgi:hypothetical protein